MGQISLIYVAGPYTHDDPAVVAGHVAVACSAGLSLCRAGLSAFVPHYFHHVQAEAGFSYEEWMAIDLRMLKHCHALLRLPGASPGADREVEAAKVLGLPVYFGIEACLAALGTHEVAR